MNKELKPCPFCGGEAAMKEWKFYTFGGNEAKRYSVRCKNEDCIICHTTDVYHTKKQAIEKWNTRAED